MDLPAQREENLAKIWEENDKKWWVSLSELERERKGLKKFEKDELNTLNPDF